ncbi:hypothetical protein LTR67_003122 [Exophiala xenobiotica]
MANIKHDDEPAAASGSPPGTLDAYFHGSQPRSTAKPANSTLNEILSIVDSVPPLEEAKYEPFEMMKNRISEPGHISNSKRAADNGNGQAVALQNAEERSRTTAQPTVVIDPLPNNCLLQKDEAAEEKKPKLPSSVAKAREAVLGLRKRVAAGDARIKALRNSERNLREANSKICEELEKRDQKVRELEGDLRKLQNEKLDRLVTDTVPSLPDDMIAQELQKFFRGTRGFVTRWAIPNWDLVDNPRHQNINRYLQDASKRDFASWSVRHAVREKKIAPKIILNALINELICNATLQRPFAHLRRDEKGQGDHAVESVMEWLVGIASADSGSEGTANIIQTNFLRALETPLPTEGQQVLHGDRIRSMNRLREAHYSITCTNLLSELGAMLKDISHEDQEKRGGELRKLIKDIGELSSTLSLQYPLIDAQFLSYFTSHTFQSEHELFCAHRGLKLKEDEDDHDGRDPEEIGMVGRRLDLVIEPLVLRRGDTDGKHYNLPKVILKAVVWVLLPRDTEESGRLRESKMLQNGPQNSSTSIIPTSFTPPVPPVPPVLEKLQGNTTTAASDHLSGGSYMDRQVWNGMQRAHKEKVWVTNQDASLESSTNCTARELTSTGSPETSHAAARAATPDLMPPSKPALPSLKEPHRGDQRNVLKELSLDPLHPLHGCPGQPDHPEREGLGRPESDDDARPPKRKRQAKYFE